MSEYPIRKDLCDETVVDGIELLTAQQKDEIKARMSKLTETIEQEIIPRLMLAFGDTERSGGSTAGIAPQSVPFLNSTHVDEIVNILGKREMDDAIQYINGLRRQGVRLRDLYLDLLAPAARRFGVLWEEDQANFTEVTLGVTRMHQILHTFSPSFCAHEPAAEAVGRSALILPVPGEQHIFGQLMVIEFFRRAGWHVWSGAPRTMADVENVSKRHNFDIIGISIGADRHLDQLESLLSMLRRIDARRPIMLGGRSILTTNGKLASDLGADGFARDGREAVDVATELALAYSQSGRNA